MKIENSTQEFCWKTTLQKNQLKLNENWHLNPKNNFTEDPINIKWKLKFQT